MPLKQRVPKLKGFNNPFRVEYRRSTSTRSTSSPSEYGAVDRPGGARRPRLVRKGAFVKVLARGEMTRKLDVHAHGVSKAAEAAITAAGGSVTLVPLPFKGENKSGRPPAKGNQFTNR